MLTVQIKFRTTSTPGICTAYVNGYTDLEWQEVGQKPDVHVYQAYICFKSALNDVRHSHHNLNPGVWRKTRECRCSLRHRAEFLMTLIERNVHKRVIHNVVKDTLTKVMSKYMYEEIVQYGKLSN